MPWDRNMERVKIDREVTHVKEEGKVYDKSRYYIMIDGTRIGPPATCPAALDEVREWLVKALPEMESRAYVKVKKKKPLDKSSKV